MSMRLEGSAEAVRPLKGAPATRHNWADMGLPETGWLLVTDKFQCSACPGEANPPCISACGVAHHLVPEARKDLGLCLHCDPAPCEDACAAGAVSRSPQGIIEIDQEICNGCKFCLDVCEHGALLWVDPYSVATPPTGIEHYTAGRPAGELPNTVAKCTFCSYRLMDGSLPVCVEACPLGAMWIGNLDRNTATNGMKIMKLSDLLGGRNFNITKRGQHAVNMND